MGARVAADRFDLADRQRFRSRLRECLQALRLMLDTRRFDGHRDVFGLEVELCLAGSSGGPHMVNTDVLTRLATRDFQSELGKFTLELNMAPRHLSGRALDDLAEELRIATGYADRTAGEFDAQVVMIGILPTITETQMVTASLSPVDRYLLLNDQIMAARGESITLDISGPERLHTSFDSIAPESACTSVQFHLQVTPDRFAATWNAAQAATAVQVAVGANSPYVFGRRLWQESRPPLFLQSTDTRPPETAAQGVRPRTWFGERWIDSPHALFEENLAYFPALLPLHGEEDPLAVAEAGGVPRLAELALHNGTVYRWNRPVYDVADGLPHLRVENRVLSTGPTVADTVANAAFFYGLVRALADQEDPVWTRLPFRTAERNFDAACLHGIDARLSWPRSARGAGCREVPAARLVEEELLPLAASGLDAFGISATDRDHYLGIIAERCRRRITGAAWQTRFCQAAERGADRTTALAALVRRYGELARTGAPVHSWPATP